MRGVAYLRVSTTEQVETGSGIELQRDAIHDYCTRNEIQLVETYSDMAVSGAAQLDRRGALAGALLTLEQDGADALLVYRLDRLARDLILQEMVIARLSAAGKSVVSVSEPELDTTAHDPTKILIRQILGALSQYERALIRARMEAGRAVKASAGGYIGGQPPYGFKAVSGALVADETEMTTVRQVRSLRAEGHSYREIAVRLEHAGIRPRRATRWHPTVLRELAQRTE